MLSIAKNKKLNIEITNKKIRLRKYELKYPVIVFHKPNCCKVAICNTF